MKPRHKVSQAGLELIKSFEGFRSCAAQLADGRWTIGYGHTKTARRGAKVTEVEAGLLLHYDLIAVSALVNALTFTPLTQNQFDALVSFAFNVGPDAFRRSTVLRRINEGAMLQAASAMDLWRKADFEGHRIVVDALVRRRTAEKVLFLTPPEGWVAAPSAVLPPRLDNQTYTDAPIETPVDLKASLVGETATVIREDAASPAKANEDAGSPPASQMMEASEALSARLAAIFPSLVADAPPLEPQATALGPHKPILPDPETPETPEAALAEPDPIPAPIPPVEAAAPEAAPVEVAPVEAPASLEPAESIVIKPAESEAPQPSAAVNALFPQPIYREAPVRDPKPAPTRREGLASAAYLLLALGGFAIFAAATTWAFGARAAGGGMKPMALGLSLAVVGIAGMAWAVYCLITKLGVHDD
jgi:lysozyme